MRLVLSAILLAGCERPVCPSLEEINIVNEDGAAPPDVMAEVQAAVEQFGAWTRGQGGCAEEIRLVSEIVTEDGRVVSGQNHEGWIEVDYDGGNITGTTQHELCHAIDREREWYSGTRPDWFPSDEPWEDFAYACQGGPRETDLVDALEDICGTDLGGGRQRYLNEEVFSGATLEPNPPRGTLTVTVDRQDVVGLPEALTWVGGASGAAHIDQVVAYDAESVSVARVDPATGSVATTVRVLAAGDQPPSLLSSDTGPVLVRQDGTQTIRAWRIDATQEEAVEVTFPQVTGLVSGWVLGDAAWLVARFPGENEVSLSRFDLQSADRQIVPWPEAITSWTSWQFTAAADGVLFGFAWSGGERTWLEYDTAAGAWSTSSSPALFGNERVPFPGGYRLATWTNWLAYEEDDAISGMALLDSEDGGWWLPEDACGESRLTSTVGLHVVRGQAFAWEYPEGWYSADEPTGDGHALTGVLIEGD